MAKVKVGDMAPDFTLPSNSEKNLTLSDFRKKKNVVLFFYPMNESPVCTREALAFKDNYETLKKLDAEVIGVSSQDTESHKSFAKHHDLPFILLSDRDNKLRKLYGVSSTMGVVPGRVTFIINKDGFVKGVFSSQVQPAKHAKEAVTALRTINEQSSLNE